MRTMIKRYDLAKDVSSSVYRFMLCICVCLHGCISFIFSSVFVYTHVCISFIFSSVFVYMNVCISLIFSSVCVYMYVCISFIFSAGSILFLVGPWQEVNERAGEKDFELQNFVQ